MGGTGGRPEKSGLHRRIAVQLSTQARAYVERMIGTIRRECLDHMIVFNERCLYRHLKSNRTRAPRVGEGQKLGFRSDVAFCI
jgi:hypothetical protein